jgi:hypothetical protein
MVSCARVKRPKHLRRPNSVPDVCAQNCSNATCILADSTYLKNVVEPFVVQWVSRRIGVTLQPRRFPVGPRTDGALVHFKFDGVSEDGQSGVN